MDIFSAPTWAQLGWGAVVFLVVMLIIRGYLVPRPFHREIVEDRDRWRTMAEELQKENTKLLITGEMGVRSMMSIEAKISSEEREDP